MREITMETIQTVEKQIGKHLADYQEEISKAYNTMMEVSISLSCKLIPEGDNIQVQTSISFIESKVKDKNITIVY